VVGRLVSGVTLFIFLGVSHVDFGSVVPIVHPKQFPAIWPSFHDGYRFGGGEGDPDENRLAESPGSGLGATDYYVCIG
jgi:hypothetical protein